MDVKEILEKLKQFRDYGGMRYRIEKGKYTGKDWLKISLGCSERGIEVFITTDCIHCSEDTGTAESDAELITILLNTFCDGTIPKALALAKLEQERKEKGNNLIKALENFIDDEPCSFDHHGYCQTHGVFNPCINEVAKQAIREYLTKEG